MSPLVRSAHRGAAILAAALIALLIIVLPAKADVATTIDEKTSASVGEEMVPYKGYLYFAADDGTHGNKLWRTDGTAAGTTMVADLNTDPTLLKTSPMRPTVTDGRLFLNARIAGGDLGGIYV